MTITLIKKKAVKLPKACNLALENLTIPAEFY